MIGNPALGLCVVAEQNGARIEMKEFDNARLKGFQLVALGELAQAIIETQKTDGDLGWRLGLFVAQANRVSRAYRVAISRTIKLTRAIASRAALHAFRRPRERQHAGRARRRTVRVGTRGTARAPARPGSDDPSPEPPALAGHGRRRQRGRA